MSNAINPTDEPLELTFEEQQNLTEILERYRANPSNSNKYRYELFAKIGEIMTAKARAHFQAKELKARIDELDKLDAQRESKRAESQVFPGTYIDYYELPINLLWNRRDALKRQKAQLQNQLQGGDRE